MHLVHYYGVLAPNAKLRSKYLAHGDLWDHLYLQARRGDREFKSLKSIIGQVATLLRILPVIVEKGSTRGTNAMLAWALAGKGMGQRIQVSGS